MAKMYEDNLSLSFVTSDQLKKRGYQVVSCRWERSLICARTDTRPLHFDIMLPQIDGFELAKNQTRK